MQAAATRLQVSANNVANVLSTGVLPDQQGNYPDGAQRAYTPQRVDQADLIGGGTRAIVSGDQLLDGLFREIDIGRGHLPIRIGIGRAGIIGWHVARPQVAQYTFAANARVVTTYDQMVKS